MDYIYPKNVSFSCNGCGLCCGDTPQKTRHILLTKAEAEAIAVHTNQPIQSFTTQTGQEPYSHEMKKTTGKCFFLENNRCQIYLHRPMICRFYPFELKYSGQENMHVFDFTLECPQINCGEKIGKKYFDELFRLAQRTLP